MISFFLKSKLECEYKYSDDRVVVDDKFVTSRGPGTCFEFAFKLAELLVDGNMSDQLKSQTLALTAWNYGLWNHWKPSHILHEENLKLMKGKPSYFCFRYILRYWMHSSGKYSHQNIRLKVRFLLKPEKTDNEQSKIYLLKNNCFRVIYQLNRFQFMLQLFHSHFHWIHNHYITQYVLGWLL